MRRNINAPISLEAAFWRRTDTISALRSRDLGQLFRLIAIYGDASQTKIGIATGLSQGQVSQVMNGTRQILNIDVLERIANGLEFPDKARVLIGLAPRLVSSTNQDFQASSYPHKIDEAAMALERLSDAETNAEPEAITLRYSGSPLVIASRDWLISRSMAHWQSLEQKNHVTNIDVAAVRDTFAAFQELDTKYGGAYTHPALVQYMRGHAIPILSAQCTDSVRRELFLASAQLVYLTGLTAFDSGLCGLSERYFAYALRLAQESGEDGFAANILAAMAHLANTHGRGNEAAQLAQAGLIAASRVGNQSAAMRLNIALARAYAIQGDKHACAQAVSSAECSLDRVGQAHEQKWTRFLDSAYLLGEMALCFDSLGYSKLTERFAIQSVEANTGRHRRLVISQAILATARAKRSDSEGASEALTTALDLMGGVRSSRTLRFIGDAITAVRAINRDDSVISRAMTILGPKTSGDCCPRVAIPSVPRLPSTPKR